MTGTEMKNVVLCVLVVVVVLFVLYQFNPMMFGLLSHEGFADADAKAAADKAAADKAAKEKADKDAKDKAEKDKAAAAAKPAGFVDKAAFEDMEDNYEDKKEGFADVAGFEGPAQFSSAQPPAGCYPRDQLTPSELLPKDMNSVWSEQNPMGPGSLKGKNFLSAGALIGVNTVGQSMRNANLQVRSEPPNPQVAVSIFNQSTISPDISHRPLEIGA
jgi:hypothetical protein